MKHRMLSFFQVDAITLIILPLLLTNGINGLKTMRGIEYLKVNEGNDITFSMNQSPDEVLTWEWVHMKTENSSRKAICQMTSGKTEVNPEYIDKVRSCNGTHLLLKNLTLNDTGYYQRRELNLRSSNVDSDMIFLNISETQKETYTTVSETRKEISTTVPETQKESSTTLSGVYKDLLWNFLVIIVIIVIIVVSVFQIKFWIIKTVLRELSQMYPSLLKSKHRPKSVELSDVVTTEFHPLLSKNGVPESSDGGVYTDPPRATGYENVQKDKQKFNAAYEETKNMHMNKDLHANLMLMDKDRIIYIDP